jgi:hypothetical protein
MPILPVIFGIIDRLWHDDRPPPHLHVEHQGFEALVQVQTGPVSQGKRPRKVAAIGQEGCLAHLRERLNHGERAQRFEPLERILRSRP